MSRHGYTEDYHDDPLVLGRWRAQVASAIRGKRGQAFLRELIEALDAMPVKRLIRNELEVYGNAGNVCAIGSVGVQRGIDMRQIDPYDYDTLASVFGVAHQLIQEIEWENDEYGPTPEARWQHMRKWAARHLRDASGTSAGTAETAQQAQGDSPQARPEGGAP